jgi:hypothetical protein
MRIIRTLLVTVAVAAALGATAVARGSENAARYNPTHFGIDPARFSANVDNPWFPLLPGTKYVYLGVKDGQPSRDVVTVTHATKTIEGVPCAVVEDRLYLRGRLEERTTDWYSQDRQGNVWYFGEQTAELDRSGRVTSTSGTWLAGRDGALPGIYMPAHPRIGQSGRQEYYKGQAEDHFRVIGSFNTVSPAGAPNAVLTEEWTPLEPGTLDNKLYVRGIGTVLEQTVKGGDERAILASVTRS